MSIANLPAYPRPLSLVERPHYPPEYAKAQQGMTYFAWLIAHAPAEPWPEFEPHVIAPPPLPQREDDPWWAFTEEERKLARGWREDPCFDLAKENPKLAGFAERWNDYWKSHSAWINGKALARRIQWPAWWAERMCMELDRRLSNGTL